MKILAIESAAETASVAILTDETLTAEYTINYKKTHSQTLLPMIAEICRMTQNKPADMDLIAVSVGPGSFTGLRIGVATGKGLALAADKQMVAVPTLAALACNLSGSDRLLCAVMDARRGNLYAGCYRFDREGRLQIIRQQCLIPAQALVEELNARGEEVIFVGDGVYAAADIFEKGMTCAFSFASAQQNTQRAGSVAWLAAAMAAEGKTISSDEIKPDYLRPSQAERELHQKP